MNHNNLLGRFPQSKISRRELIQDALAEGIGLAAAESMFAEALASTQSYGVWLFP